MVYATPTVKRLVLLSLASVASLVAIACGSSHDFASPKEQQGPPQMVLPPEPTDGTNAPPGPSAGPVAQAAPVKLENVSFFRTQDSDEWVTKNFKLQSTYSRVLAVRASGDPPPKIAMERLDLNAAAGRGSGSIELTVTKSFKTIEEAIKEAEGGDLVAVFPGRYKGAVIGAKPSAGDGKYIHVKAMGSPGDVIIDAPGSDRNWMVLFRGSHHVIFQGFVIEGKNPVGTDKLTGPKAGILIDGAFPETSTFAHHIAIVGVYSHHHARWGMHSVDSRTVLMEDSLYAYSAAEHGAYVSDGSDDYVIRRNVFFENNASGLQCNVDPLASLDKLRTHPAMEKHPPPSPPNRDWAVGIIKKATETFGANNFPDGRGFNYIIESNVMQGNGHAGGAALNLAGVRESLIQNNLIYGNHASGIAQWNNGNPYDEAQDHPGPRSPAQVTGADVLGLFGCFNNLVRHNTVLSAVRGRPALQAGNGSWGMRAYNNILINDDGASVEIFNTAMWRFDGGYNVIGRVNYEGPAAALKSLAISLPDGSTANTGLSRSSIMPHVVQFGSEPWVILEGTTWKLNPKRPDFRPRSGSSLLAGRGDSREIPKMDIDGKKRSAPDIGAYAAASP